MPTRRNLLAGGAALAATAALPAVAIASGPAAGDWSGHSDVTWLARHLMDGGVVKAAVRPWVDGPVCLVALYSRFGHRIGHSWVGSYSTVMKAGRTAQDASPEGTILHFEPDRHGGGTRVYLQPWPPA